MKRTYLCTYDDGHDYGSFSFESEHRAGSKANKNDAVQAAIRKYGRRVRQFRLIGIYRYDAR